MGRTKYWNGSAWVEIAPSAQEFDAHLADYVKQPANGGTTGGTGTAYTCSSDPAPSALVDKIGVVITAHVDSGANPTLNWDGKGAKSIKKPNGNAASLKAGGIYTLRYNVTTQNFILQGEGGVDLLASDLKAGVVVDDVTGTFTSDATATSPDIISGKTAYVNGVEVIGTRKTKIWELPNNRTHVINEGQTGSTPNYRFSYKNVKVYQPYNSSSLSIYYKGIFLVTLTLVNAMYEQKGQVHIDDDENIYIFMNTNSTMYTLLKSEGYSIIHSTVITGVSTSGRVGHVNFRYGNFIFFTAEFSSTFWLFKFDISSGIATQVSSVQLQLLVGNYVASLFALGNMAYYLKDNTNIAYTINLDSMTVTQVTCSASGAYYPMSYLGYYNNYHFLIGYNNVTNRYVVMKYANTGGAPISYYELAYSDELAADVGAAGVYYYPGYGNYAIQANDNVVVLFPGASTSYNDSIAYFDMSIEKVIKIERGVNGGTSGYTYPIGIANKVFGFKTYKNYEIVQFEV